MFRQLICEGYMGAYEDLKIHLIEEDRRDFIPNSGMNIENFVARKNREKPNTVIGFCDYAGEYYRKPEYFQIGEDKVYKKKQYAGEIDAEILLGYVYNDIGIPSPIAYPFFMKRYIPSGRWLGMGEKPTGIIADGVVTKDIMQVFPTATKRGDVACHTLKGLFTDDKCLEVTTKRGRLARVKETIASIAFNNKDAGFDNSFWTLDSDGKYDSVISIDHGYSGRDSMYSKDRDSLMRSLYFKGEHGYNGMYDYEEDRGTVLHFLRRLLAGEKVDGVQFSDEEIKELHQFISDIAKVDFKQIALMYAERFKWTTHPLFMQNLEWCREDMVDSLDK